MQKNEFVEVGKVKTSDAGAAMISKVVSPEGKVVGLSLGKWVETEKYTGPAKSFMVPIEHLDEFEQLFKKAKAEAMAPAITR